MKPKLQTGSRKSPPKQALTHHNTTASNPKPTTHLIVRGRPLGLGHLHIPEVVHRRVRGEGLLRQVDHGLVHLAVAELQGPFDGSHVREPHVQQEGDILVLLLHPVPVEGGRSVPANLPVTPVLKVSPWHFLLPFHTLSTHSNR